MENNSSEKPMLQQLRELEVGENLIFPAEKRGTIRSMCTMFGFEWNKTFSSKINRKDRTITVTRIR